MYGHYFGLSEPPFAIAPDPRFLYMSEQHREALAHLLYGITSNGGFVLLTGEVGTGKTTVSRCLLEQLPEGTDVALILNPRYSANELLAAICDELGLPCSAEAQFKTRVDQLNRRLLDNFRQNRQTVLIIDEAQNLSEEVLETIRLLTNLETNTEKLLRVVLIGQPELGQILARPALRQLSQRITARCHLHPLKQYELAAYLTHRLSVAGVDQILFPPRVIRRLFRLTEGVPRLVNVICDRALLGAYVQRHNRVNSKTLLQAAREVLGADAVPARPRFSWGLMLLLAVVVILGAVAGPLQSSKWPQAGLAALAEGVKPLQRWFRGVSVTEVQPLQGSLPQATAQVRESASQVSTGTELSNPANWQWQSGTPLEATEALAYQALFKLWGLEYQPRQQPRVCDFAAASGLACQRETGDLALLQTLNRPAVLRMFNARGDKFYATLVAIRDEVAELEIADQRRRVAVADLKLWLAGTANLLWRLPQYYRRPIEPGVSGPEVIWLDRQLAQAQGRPPRYFRLQTYDAGLVTQVKRFQQQHNLSADGVVGPRTAILLSGFGSHDSPLLQPGPARQGGEGGYVLHP